MRMLTLLSAVTVGSVMLFAEDDFNGTASFSQDGLGYLSQDKALLESVTNSLDVQDVGKCFLIVSGSKPMPVAKMPAYKFSARARGSSGPYNLVLILPPQMGSMSDGTVSLSKASIIIKSEERPEVEP